MTTRLKIDHLDLCRAKDISTAVHTTRLRIDHLDLCRAKDIFQKADPSHVLGVLELSFFCL